MPSKKPALPAGTAALVVGITGGIASGKSTVCALFEANGASVLHADPIAHDIVASDKTVRANITALLGPDAFLPDGAYNRAGVAAKVFADRALLNKLNKIIHPAVVAEVSSRVERLRAKAEALIVVEAALLYEAGMDKHLDAVVAVVADDALRMERAMARGAADREDVRRRIAAQLPQETLKRKADFTIINNGSREMLGEQVAFLLTIFRAMRPA